MPLFENDKYHMMVIGDYHPVKVMDGDRTVARAAEAEQTGTVLSFDNTYNDLVESLTIHGTTPQNVTVTGRNIFDQELSFAYHSGGASYPPGKTIIPAGIRLISSGSPAWAYYAAFDIGPFGIFAGKTMHIRTTAIASAANIGRVMIVLANDDYSTTATLNFSASAVGALEIDHVFPASHTLTRVCLAFYINNPTYGTVAAGDYMDYTDLMVQLGSAVHPYAPYVGQTYLVDTGPIEIQTYPKHTVITAGGTEITAKVRVADLAP